MDDADPKLNAEDSPWSKVTDEKEKFKYPLNTFACVVGKKLSPANYYLKDWREVPLLIDEMASFASK